MSQDRDISHDGVEERDRVLIAAYRGESEELPSPAVDDAIRAAARKAVGARPRAPGRFRFGGWNVPLAAAATVVLSATVAFMAVREHGLDGLREATPPRGMASAPAAVAVPAPAESAATVQSAPAETAPAKAAGAYREDSLASSEPLGITAARPAASPARAAGGESRSAVPSGMAESREEESASVAPDDALRRAVPASATPADRLPGSPSVGSADASIRGRARVASEASSHSESAPAGVPPPTPVLPGPALEEGAKSAAHDAQGERPATPPAVEPAAAHAQAPVPAAASLPREASHFRDASPKAADRIAAPPSPEAHVTRIRSLLRDGRRAEALAALSALRRDYPDYALPADLSGLAKELPASSR